MTDQLDDRKQQFQAEGRKAATRVRDLASLYRACFDSDAGKKVLEDLHRCYGGSTAGHSPRQTDLRSAQRDVLLRIEDMLAIASTETETAVNALSQSPEHVNALMNPWRDR